MNLLIVGSQRAKSEVAHGGPLTARYLSLALDAALVSPGAGAEADVAICVDCLPGAGIRAARFYIWVTQRGMVYGALRQWMMTGKGRFAIPASAMIADLCRREGMRHESVRVPVGVADGFSEASRDPGVRHNVYVAHSLWTGEHGTLRAIEAFLRAWERRQSLRLTLFGKSGEAGYDERIGYMLDKVDHVTMHGQVAHAEMPARVAPCGVLLHLPMREEGGLCVKEAMVAGRAIVGNRCGVLDEFSTWTCCGARIEDAANELLRITQNERAWLEASNRCARAGRGLRWSNIAARWRGIV